MKRIAAFTYGLLCYVIFLGTFLYAIPFLGNFGPIKTIDGVPEVSFGQALGINLLLLSIFAVQHSLMARPTFKRWWTRIIPEPIERSTYVLLSSVALLLLFHLWEPMGGIIWEVSNPVGIAILYGLYAGGWLLVLVATFWIHHFDLFGMRQVWLYLRGQEYTPLGFMTPGLYKHVRHPLYVGWLTVFWATPTMTVAHFVFALATTAYILVAIQLEERNLEEFHGQPYADYRRRVPMLIPGLAKKTIGKPSVDDFPVATT